MAADDNVMYLGRHLLDHQIVGVHGDQIGKVDDIEFDDVDGGTPRVSGLLTGQIAYGARFGGVLGEWITSSAQRLRGQAADVANRIDISLVKSITHTVTLRVPSAEVPTPDLENWLATHFIGRIPGAGG